jgi:hypothetical protein
MDIPGESVCDGTTGKDDAGGGGGREMGPGWCGWWLCGLSGDDGSVRVVDFWRMAMALGFEGAEVDVDAGAEDALACAFWAAVLQRREEANEEESVSMSREWRECSACCCCCCCCCEWVWGIGIWDGCCSCGGYVSNGELGPDPKSSE